MTQYEHCVLILTTYEPLFDGLQLFGNEDEVAISVLLIPLWKKRKKYQGTSLYLNKFQYSFNMQLR